MTQETREAVLDDIGERERERRDLREQLDSINEQDLKGVRFEIHTEGREPVTLWSMTDGQPISIPRYMVSAALSKRDPETGRYRLTNRQEEAPAFKPGNLKCFLHPDSAERPILDDIGLQGKVCRSEHIASPHSRRLHAEGKHKAEWKAYQEWLTSEEKREDKEARRQQLDATLSLAREATGGASPGKAKGG